MNLKEKRAALIKQANEIVDKAIAEARAMNAEEKVQYDAALAEAEGLKATVEAEERAKALEAEVRGAAAPAIRPTVGGEARTEEDEKKVEYRSNFKNFLAKGAESRTLTPGATPGSYLVSDTLLDRIVRGYGVYGGVVGSKATRYRTAQGNEVKIPVNTDSASAHRTNASGAAVGDPGLTQAVLATYEYTSDIVKVSHSMLNDSAFDVEAYLSDVFAERMFRGTNTDFTTGTGTAMPFGVVTSSTLGVTGASATAVAYAELNNLMFAVSAPVRMAGEWMMNENTLKAVAALIDQDNKKIYDVEKNTLLGKNVVINSAMADMGVNAKSILFGDFSKFYVREVTGDAYVQRFNELYAAEGCVGFTLFARFGGVLANDGSCIKHFKNAAA